MAVESCQQGEKRRKWVIEGIKCTRLSCDASYCKVSTIWPMWRRPFARTSHSKLGLSDFRESLLTIFLSPFIPFTHLHNSIHHVFPWLQRSQVQRGHQDRPPAAGSAGGGHEQCPRSHRSTSPFLPLSSSLRPMHMLTPSELENQRELLRCLCSRPRLFPLLQGEYLHV